MAVFTQVTPAQLAPWLAAYEVGALTHLEGIASGIENSNFFVTTSHGEYVLTLFEVLTQDQLPFYLGLMRHLAAAGVPCPDPIADRSGAILGTLRGKPAALVTRLSGRSLTRPGPEHCAEVGRVLADMHAGARGLADGLPNLRGLAWWQATAPRVRPFLSPDQRDLLDAALAAQQQFANSAEFRELPRSPVHADLFRDNVLFDESDTGPRLSGVIDFYFAGVDSWLYDLAVTANDWCIDETNGAFDPDRLDALLRAYSQQRPFMACEHASWPMMLRAAALRFWLSRLFDFHLPRPAEMVTPKDPAHFERLLRARSDALPGSLKLPGGTS